MRYRVLGPVEAKAGETPVRLGGPKQRLVLAILLTDADRQVSDDRLVLGVWGDDAPARPRHILQTYVSELRRLLEDEIRREGAGYRLVTDPEMVDAHRFEVLVGTARDRLADSPGGAAATLREALALWQGTPYADLADAAVLQPEIHRLEQMRLAAVEDRLRSDLECGRHAEVVAELESLTREHPYREGLRAAHMLALYRCGRQADALLVYERSRELLSEELGIDPSPDLQALQRRVLEQDPVLDPPRDGGPPDAPADAGSGGATNAMIRGFELRERLGRGDHGTTYRAYQPSIGREVAVKVLSPDGASTGGFVRTFTSRTAAIASLNHPHLVPLLDSWRDPDAAYVVTPWFRAGDARRTLHTGPWSLPAMLRLLDQVGGALATAHHHGVVHGGVKATNVLIDADGNACLTDFPVTARAVDALGAPHSRTPALVAPEEGRGDPLSPRTDVHGLGRLAVELLQGSMPAVDDPVGALARSRPDLPTALLDVLRRAVASDPENRHDRVEDLLRDVRRAAGADVVGLPGPSDGERPARNPYKGLQAFREPDAGDFFGREALTRRLVEAVGAHRLVAVVGPSGSGKSSLVRAGLVPAVRAGALPGSRDWLVTELYPGSYPFEELEAALRRVAVEEHDGTLAELVSDDRGLLRVVKQILPNDDSELVLVIDQFEELFVLTADPAVRRRFLDSLVALARDARGRVRTVLTMRGDFFDRPLEHHAFGELLQAGLVPVTVPAPDELTRAIIQPARQVGVEFEDGLVPAIVRDVADQPGGLPLLQHALTELFARHEGSLITTEAYRAAGGVMGALGRRADELYRSLSPDAQAAAEQILLRLVSVDEHADDARRRLRRSELTGLTADPATVDEVIQAFGAHRLLTFDRDPVTRTPTVEVAHEALFRQWGRLRDWIETRRADLLLHRRLSAAVAEWVQAGRDDGYLLTGARLEQFDAWADHAPIALADAERDLLETSRARQRRLAMARRRRRRGILVAAILAAIVGLSLAALAFRNQQRAARGERVAVARALAADSRARLQTDHDHAVRLALQAVETTRAAGEDPLPEAVQALHDAVRLHRVVQTADHDGLLVRFLGDGRRLLSTGPPGMRPVVWDLDTGASLRVLDHSGQEPTDLAVSPDGRLLAETYMGGPVRVWDLGSGDTVATLQPGGAGQWRPVFSPDGRTLALLDDRDGQWWLSIWDVQQGTERASVPAPQQPSATAFGPGGGVVAVASSDSAVVRLYDAATGEPAAILGRDDPGRGVSSIAFDPSGRLAVYLREPSEIEIRAVGSPEPELVLPVGADPNTLCVTGDGGALAATAADEVVRVWDARSGDLILRLPGNAAGGVLDCGPQGTMIATATTGGSARVWDITPEGEGHRLTIATPPTWSTAWTADGQAILSTHGDGSLRRHEASTGRLTARADDLLGQPPGRLAVSPDGRYVAVTAPPTGAPEPGGPPSGPVRLLDAGTLRPVRDAGVAGFPAAFGADSTRLLVVGTDGTALVDVASGQPVWEVDEPAADGGLPAGGGEVVVAPFGAPEVRVLDVDDGAAVATICLAHPARRVAVSPDGGLVAVATPATVEVFDLHAALAAGAGRGCSADRATGDAAGHVASLEANAWTGLGFGPDGRSLATAGFDGVVGVWDAATGRNRLRIAHQAQVGGVAFSADGSRLLAGINPTSGALPTVRVYSLDVDELVQIAQGLVSRGP